MNLIGRTVGSFQIVEEIGRGGMATVYKAWQPSLNRYVALKVLSPFLQQDPEFIARFEREARAAAHLEHPSIIAIYDAGSVDGVSYMAMALVEGQSLQEMLIQQGPLDSQTVVRIATEIAGALEYAHNRGVTHRDVKPSNILIRRDGRAVLTDFGIAQAVGATRLTRTGTLVGTPEYMSPEQIEGLSLDYRTDIYSLGVVVYHMLTGQVPFQGTTPQSVLYGHVHKKPPLPTRLNPALSRPVEAVVLKALAKDPAQRFQRAGELADALRQAMAGEKPIPPTKTGVWIAAGAAAILVLVVILWALTRGPTPSTPMPGPSATTSVAQREEPSPTPAPPSSSPAAPSPTAPPSATTLPSGQTDEVPLLTIISPGSQVSTRFGQQVRIDTIARDDNGVVSIRLWVDGQLAGDEQVGGGRQVQWTIYWDPPDTAATYLLELKAVDTIGQVSDRAQVLVSVEAPTPSSTPQPLPPTPTTVLTAEPTPLPPTPTTAPTSVPTPLPPTPTLTPTRVPATLPPCSIQVADRFAGFWDRGRLGCPTANSHQTLAADQFFQHGFMLWREDADRIYVFYNDRTVQSFRDEFVEGTDPDNRGLIPPAPGLQEPRRGFGKVWHEKLGGPDAAIGWATELEMGFELVVQDFEGGMIFWRDRVGTVVADWDEDTWQ